MMRWFWSVARARSVIAAAACVVLFVAAIVSGLGMKSFVIVGAAAIWVVLAKYEGDRARAAHRHHELRERRLRRMRDGTWTGPYRDD